MLRHVYAVVEYYEDHNGYSEELLACFTGPEKANQYVELNYQVEKVKHISSCAIHTIKDNPYLSVEVRLLKLDPNPRGEV